MPEASVRFDQPPTGPMPERRSLGRFLFSGTSALGVATVIERGLGFLANIAAARLAGAAVFGAYSVAWNTANSVASYAGAGIGTTALRFAGEYPYGRPGYGALVRALSLFSLGSAALAALVLWVAAKPLAVHLFRNPGLTHLLRVAALSAGAIILMECLRGFLIGQRRFAALLTFCILSGAGLLLVLPAAALFGAPAMAMGQAGVTLMAVLGCVLWARKLRFSPTENAEAPRLSPRALVKFGSMQLLSMVGMNAAGWWVASLVARSDISLVQVGWYSVALQMRNITAMPPGLISQTAYAQMTEAGGQHYGGPGRVAVFSTMAAGLAALLVSAPVAALVPWLMPHLYGRGYAGAEFAATLAIAMGVVHMSSAPAVARLTVVSLPLMGIINGIWAVIVVCMGTWLVPQGGAAEATVAFLVAHLASALLVLLALLRLDCAPRQLVSVSLPPLAGAIILAVLGRMRSASTHKILFSGVIIACMALLVLLAARVVRRNKSTFGEIDFTKIPSKAWAALIESRQARAERRNEDDCR